MVSASIFTWQGTLSALAAAGMGLVALGRLQQNAAAMRVMVLAGGPFWLLHDLIIASPVAIADAASLAAGLWHMAKEPRWAPSWRGTHLRTLLARGPITSCANRL
jgi:hypothetical protein